MSLAGLHAGCRTVVTADARLDGHGEVRCPPFSDLGVGTKRQARTTSRAEIVQTGRFSPPDFGSFTVRETPRRTALNPRTGERVDVKAGAAVRFKASPSLKAAAFAGLKRARRKTAKRT